MPNDGIGENLDMIKTLLDLDSQSGDNDQNVDDKFGFSYDTTVSIPYDNNRIVFGAPGTGKSFNLQRDFEEVKKIYAGAEVERVTFHPDYTYAQFVGTYKPVMDENGEKIKYEFIPGPFMRVLTKALLNAKTNSHKPYILIIEEINRARVASVFGDIFQLLDRNNKGISEYAIQTSEDIRRYLAPIFSVAKDDIDTIRIPNNMFIWSTMTSADQGVFSMDTAFKRRWNFEYLGINDGEKKIEGIAKFNVANSSELIEWNKLRKAINMKMSSTDFRVNEDKLMGPFFISMKLLESDDNGVLIDEKRFIQAFKSKVLMYLYEDAIKQRKHDFFENCDTSRYSEICDAFDKKGLDIFGSSFLHDFYE